MDAKQRKNLAKMGGRISTVQEFLGLSDAEVRLMDLKIQLVGELRDRRAACKMTQAQLAKVRDRLPAERAWRTNEISRSWSTRRASRSS